MKGANGLQAKQMMTTNLVTVTENATLQEIIQLMLDKNISGIPVVDEKGELKGVVSESDVLRLKRKLHMPDYMQLLETMLNNSHPEYFNAEVAKSLKMAVSDFMTRKLITISADTSLAEITRLMVEHGINRIPVVHDGKLVGIVTRRDAIRAMATAIE